MTIFVQTSTNNKCSYTDCLHQLDTCIYTHTLGDYSEFTMSSATVYLYLSYRYCRNSVLPYTYGDIDGATKPKYQHIKTQSLYVPV